MSDDGDRYDLDESNMFQTSFNDSSYFGPPKKDADPDPNPDDKGLGESFSAQPLSQSIADSEDTVIQSLPVLHNIGHEAR